MQAAALFNGRQILFLLCGLRASWELNDATLESLETHPMGRHRGLRVMRPALSLPLLCDSSGAYTLATRGVRVRPIRGEVVLRGTANSQLADGLHEVVHFSVHGRLADSQVLLHADAGKEGQDHICKYRWFHLGFLGFYISRDQIFEKSVALRNDFLRRAREHRELVHGIDREAAFLTFQAAGREFQKALDVLPTERVGGQQLLLLLFSQVVSQTLQIQISLARELGIEAGLVYARRLFQVLKAGIREAVFPEDRQRLLQNTFPAEVLRPPHAFIMTY
jgi:hypothetical protein